MGLSAINIHSQLRDVLAAAYPAGLFTHQAMAITSVLQGHNTVVATRTSSGKSLIYSVPVFDRLLAEPAATALFVYPQKALANDQLSKLQYLASALCIGCSHRMMLCAECWATVSVDVLPELLPAAWGEP